MDARTLDRRITLESQDDAADDGFNTQPGDFIPFATVWAAYQPVSDGERLRAQQVGATVTDRFIIRWSSEVANLNPQHQLVFEGRRYAITAVKPTAGVRTSSGPRPLPGRNRWLEITATAQADTGPMGAAQ